MFLVPTKLIPTALTRLFSLRTKIRMGLELLHPPRPSGGDESVAALVERHFGAGGRGPARRSAAERHLWRRRRATERADGAAAAGGDGDEVRLADARHAGGAPQMRAGRRAKNDRLARRGKPRGAGRSFTALRGGMQQLVDALVARLDPASVRSATPVSAIAKSRRTAGALRPAAAAEIYDAVIMAAPAWAAGALLGPVDAALGEELGGIPYSSSITVNLIYDEAKLGHAAGGIRISGSGGRGARHAGLHVCASQVSGAHAAGKGCVSRVSGRDEE